MRLLRPFLTLCATVSLSAQSEELPSVVDLTIPEPPIGEGEVKPGEAVQAVFPEESDVVQPLQKALPQETLSVDKRFKVFGGLAKERTEIIRAIEAVSKEWSRELGEKEDNANGSSVQLKTENPPVQIVLKRVEKGKNNLGSSFIRSFGKLANEDFYVRLTIDLNSPFTVDNLRSAIVETLLLEKSILSVDELAEDAKVVFHPWVVDGILEVIDWRKSKKNREHYQELAENPKLFPLKKMLDVSRVEITKLDAASYRSYRAASGAMVMTMLKQPGGLDSMQKMLEELSFFDGDMSNLLKRHFSEMNKGVEGERIAWLLQLNTMALKPVTESFSIIETERELSELLLFRVFDEDEVEQVYALQEFEKLMKLGEETRKVVISGAMLRLTRLQNRCFPIYRPMLFQYATILNSLSQGETKGVENIIRNLGNERALKRQAAIRARDYMDWYVLNHSDQLQGNYQSFNIIKNGLLQQNQEKDVMDTYLDKMDAFFAE